MLVLLGRGLKDLTRRHNRVTVNHNRIVNLLRIAPGVGNHHRHVLRLGYTEDELIAPLQTF